LRNHYRAGVAQVMATVAGAAAAAAVQAAAVQARATVAGAAAAVQQASEGEVVLFI
jgi:hypothetical protein